MPVPFSITIHMVASLDGFIAKKDNSVGWFETAHPYAKGVEPPNAEIFLSTIDCYVMGANTYLHALELSKVYGWPYGDTPTIVVTHRSLPVERANIEFFSGNLQTLVAERLQPRYNNAWLAGGAMLAQAFLRLKLADEIRLSILPVILGDGVHFFNHIGHEQVLHLKDVTAYKNGLVELWYEIKK